MELLPLASFLDSARGDGDDAVVRSIIGAMPTVLREGPYRIYFYSHEPNEPPHVHVDRDDDSAKFWLER